MQTRKAKKAQKATKIKIVFFDFGGVLVNNISDRTFKLASRLTKAPISEVKLRFYQHHVAHQIGKESLFDCWNRINRELGVPQNRLSYISRRLVLSYKVYARPRPAVFNIVKRLNEKRIRTGLISDTCEEHAQINFRRRFYRYFDPLILSHKVGAKKPGTRIFQLALKRARVKPSESVFVDDRALNVKTANLLGFKAILFRNSRQLRQDLKKLGVF